MKLNNIFKAAVVGVVGLTAWSCDNIDSDDRYIDITQQETTEIPRWVLLEEYTGQMCINCPKGHAVINSLQDVWGERLVAVGIQGNEFVLPVGIAGSLATDEGRALADAANVSSPPKGRIDRTGGILDPEGWSAAVRKSMYLPTPLNMTIAPTLSADGKTIDIKLSGSVLEDVEGNICVWIIENDIVALQLDGSQYIMDYVHNHVFRAWVNGQNGTPVKWIEGGQNSLDLSIPVNDGWNTEHIAVVAFVYNNGGVVQAIEAHLGKTVSNTDAKHEIDLDLEIEN